jgi:hypothetical protein
VLYIWFLANLVSGVAYGFMISFQFLRSSTISCSLFIA